MVTPHEIEAFKANLLQKLKEKPAPYGAPENSPERGVLEQCLNDLARIPPSLAGCAPEFATAVKKIMRYNPDLITASAHCRFRAFQEHRRKYPEFYGMLDRVARVVVANKRTSISAAMLYYRAAFELYVHEGIDAHRGLNVNITALYGDYWNLRNPEVPLTFNRRQNRAALRRRSPLHFEV